MTKKQNNKSCIKCGRNVSETKTSIRNEGIESFNNKLNTDSTYWQNNADISLLHEHTAA